MRGAIVVRTVLAIVLLVAVFASIGAVGTNPTAGALPDPDWQPYIDAGKTVTLALTTVDYRTVDGDIQRILDNSTGAFYANFNNRSAEFAQFVRDAQLTSSSTITEARLESFNDSGARVLVAFTETTTNAGQPVPGPREHRLLITVQKVGESYKASKVEYPP